MKERTKSKTKAATNALKGSSIAEQLVKNIDCANDYNKKCRFRVNNHCKI